MIFRLCLLIILMFPNIIFSQENIETLIKKGNGAFDKMEYEKALNIYNKSLKAAPKEPVIFYNKGNVLQQLEKFDDALEEYNEAIKNDPEKILLKNIYFNAGNAHYKIAEKKIKEGENELETLKVALAEFELACNLYKKSLETEREIAISKGYDIKKTGAYAKKNWALARQGWADTWEIIRALEKKNMKLEDGINNLLIAQRDLLPRLEKYYLFSHTEDNLKFNLKTLVQYQLDHKEDIVYLMELSDKEVERANAEFENYKSIQNTGQNKSQQSASPQSPVPQDEEQTKLEQQLKNVKEIQNAVGQASGFEEWILDGLNRGEPLKAWKNSYLMITLLTNLNNYLKKNDIIKNTYTQSLNLFKDIETLLIQSSHSKEDKKNDYLKDFKDRFYKLSTEKLDAAALNFVSMNAQMDMMLKEIEKQKEKEAQNESQKGNENKNVVRDYLTKLNVEMVKASLSDVQQANSKVLSKIKATADVFLKGKANATDVSEIMDETTVCLVKYENFTKSIIEILTLLIKETDEILIKISEISGDDRLSANKKFSFSLNRFDILSFKYQFLVDDITQTKEPELQIFRKKLPENLNNINFSGKEWFQAKAYPFKNMKDTEKFARITKKLKQEMIRGLTILAPEVSASLYYEKIQALNKAAIELLPSSVLNKIEIQENLKQTLEEISSLETVLQQYFENAEEILSLEKDKDKDKKDEGLKNLEYRKQSIDKLMFGSGEIKDTIKYLNKDQYLKSDLLINDLPSTFGKSYLVFLGHPGDAVKTLEGTIALQKDLEEQNRAVMEVESREGNSILVNKYLVQNQTDVMALSGISSMKIRKMIEESSAQKDQANPLQGAGGQTCPNADPKKLEEAITHIQDAIIEEQKIHSFLNANEYANTTDTHTRVIELLNKALELLKNEGDGKQDENNRDQNKDKEDQNQQEQQQQQQQNNQQNQDQQAGQQKSQPLELTPEQARELLNQLDQEDDKRNKEKAQGKTPINVPRPW